MIIGVDLDNCVFDYTGALRHSIAEQLGVTDAAVHLENYPDPTDYGMSNWPDFPDAFAQFHLTAVDNGLYQKLTPYKDASETLWKLSEEGHHLRVITSRFVGGGRNAKVIADTGISLDKHNIPYRDIVFTNFKADIECDVFIDDSPKNIEALRGREREVIIYNALYNQHIPGRHAANWDDVYRHIQELS